MGNEMVLIVTSLNTVDESFIPTYGYPISDCAGVFESEKEYHAILYSRFYKYGSGMAETLSITVYNGSHDGYDDPDGRNYTSISEFNADWKVVKIL